MKRILVVPSCHTKDTGGRTAGEMKQGGPVPDSSAPSPSSLLSRRQHQQQEDERRWNWHCQAVVWYLVCGIVHEVSHAVVALWWINHHRNGADWIAFLSSSSLFQSIEFWYSLLVGRQLILPVEFLLQLQSTTTTNSNEPQLVENAIPWIRHVGWMFSLLLAMALEYRNRCRRPQHQHWTASGQHCGSLSSVSLDRRVSPLHWAAWVTAAEAVWTDLLHGPQVAGLVSSSTTSSQQFVCFACGNFGMILLHHAWFSQDTGGTQASLSILEKLIQVTMMRGAQAGGVVCFHPTTTTNTTTTNCLAGCNYPPPQAPSNPATTSSTVNPNSTSNDHNNHETEEAMLRTIPNGEEQGGGGTAKPQQPQEQESTSKTQDPADHGLVQLRGIRTRIVNQKRSDLSVLLRQTMARDNHFTTTTATTTCCSPNHHQKLLFPPSFVPVLFGHTRFATSSKATIPDTHPHRWSPPAPRRVFCLSRMRHQTTHHHHNNNNHQQQSQRGGGGALTTESSTGSSSDSTSSTSHTNTARATTPSSCWEPPQVLLVENYVTHNGDFDFYRVNGNSYELGQVQKWLERVLDAPLPAQVDSCAIAGVMDVLRTQGCFGLSARYAICLGLASSLPSSLFEFILACEPASSKNKTRNSKATSTRTFPPYSHFEAIGMVFEEALEEMLKTTTLSALEKTPGLRKAFTWRVVSKLKNRRAEFFSFQSGLDKFITDDEGGASLQAFCMTTIRAFFDNDLMSATQMFMANAAGSFGIAVTSSLDAHRQLCLAARGQSISLAFYPRKGMILYGSDQGAVKAGLGVPFPGNAAHDLDHSTLDVDNDSLRLDLDGTLSLRLSCHVFSLCCSHNCGGGYSL